jgi:hypothetical protein
MTNNEIKKRLDDMNYIDRLWTLNSIQKYSKFTFNNWLFIIKYKKQLLSKIKYYAR